MKITQIDSLPDEIVRHNAAISKKVLLRSGEIPQLTQFSQARFPAGQIAKTHSHPDLYEVFFVESGQGIMQIEGTAHALSPGTCITVEPNEKHEVVNTGQQELVLTYFGLKSV